ARRRAPDRDRLAARGFFRRAPLAVGDQQLHADGGDVPARRGEPAEQRVAPLLLGEMEALRIELRGEALDVLRGEGDRAEGAAVADLDVFEEGHVTLLRRDG